MPDDNSPGTSSLWVEYEQLRDPDLNFAMKRVFQPQEIYPVFCDLFRKERTRA